MEDILGSGNSIGKGPEIAQRLLFCVSMGKQHRTIDHTCIIFLSMQRFFPPKREKEFVNTIS